MTISTPLDGTRNDPRKRNADERLSVRLAPPKMQIHPRNEKKSITMREECSSNSWKCNVRPNAVVPDDDVAAVRYLSVRRACLADPFIDSAVAFVRVSVPMPPKAP